MKQWLPMNHQRQPPLITTAAHLANHHSTPQLRGSYGAHGYGCSFSESSLLSRWVAIVAQREGVIVMPPHYHKSGCNSLSRPERQILHCRLHTISRETTNTQIHKGNNKNSLFHI
jgi:hypothetical protein